VRREGGAPITRGLVILVCTNVLTLGHAAPAAGEAGLAPVSLAEPGLSISAPTNAALGSGAPGTSFSRRLEAVTVTSGAGVTQWTATVTLTSAFTVTQGDQSWHLPNDRVLYSSGPATAGTVSLSLCTAGQTSVAATLVQSRTAFRCSGLLGPSTSSVSWRPTLSVQTQPTDPAGTYTGTITHSVA
jgi:hypothetical protein